MVELNELEDGNLEIKVTDKEEFNDLFNKETIHDERDYLCEMLEDARYIGNGYMVPFNIGLTEAPAIAYDFSIDDDGEMTDCEKLWYFPSYQVESYMEQLKELGWVIFELHRDE